MLFISQASLWAPETSALRLGHFIMLENLVHQSVSLEDFDLSEEGMTT